MILILIASVVLYLCLYVASLNIRVKEIEEEVKHLQHNHKLLKKETPNAKTNKS